MKYLRSFEVFNEEAGSPVVKPAPTTTPTTVPRPTRPSVVPTERPSEEDAPLAVIDRFKKIYKNLDDKEKKKIDSYFK